MNDPAAMAVPFPFPAAGPFPDPADPSGETLAITLWLTPEDEEIRASYRRNGDSWKLAALSLHAEGETQQLEPAQLAGEPADGAPRLQEIVRRVGLKPPRELHLGY